MHFNARHILAAATALTSAVSAWQPVLELPLNISLSNRLNKRTDVAPGIELRIMPLRASIAYGMDRSDGNGSIKAQLNGLVLDPLTCPLSSGLSLSVPRDLVSLGSLGNSGNLSSINPTNGSSEDRYPCIPGAENKDLCLTSPINGNGDANSAVTSPIAGDLGSENPCLPGFGNEVRCSPTPTIASGVEGGGGGGSESGSGSDRGGGSGGAGGGEGSGGKSQCGSGAGVPGLHFPGINVPGLCLPKIGNLAINGLNSFASSLSELVGAAGRSASALAGGGSGTRSLSSGDVSAVAKLFSNIFQGVSDLAAASEEIELSSFGGGDITDVINMQDSLRNLRDLLKADLSDISRFITNPPKGLTDFKRIASQFAAGGSIAGLTEVSLNYIIHHDGHKHNENNDGRNRKTTASATAVVSSSTAAPTSWVFNTVPGTSREAFESFVSKLPDRGSGRRIIFPRLGYQNYIGKMTLEEAKAVSKNPIVDQIGPNDLMIDLNDDGPHRGGGTTPQFFAREQHDRHAVPDEWQHYRHLPPGIHIVYDPASPLHLKMISLQKHKKVADLDEFNSDQDSQYIFDKSAGAGSYVYVLDCGFQFSHPEFERSFRGEKYISSTLVDRDNNPVTSFVDESSHGTAVAAMAVGDTVGVAKNAQLIGVKFRGRGNNRRTSRGDMIECWSWIVNDVIDRHRSGKAVLVLSYGFEYQGYLDNNGHVDYRRNHLDSSLKCDFFLPLLRDAWDHGIITVVSSGNKHGKPLGAFSPQRFGREDNPLITVASLYPIGIRSRDNSRQGPSTDGADPLLTGSITVYAQGNAVKCAQAYSSDRFEYCTGSSFAAPQVGGLAAYLLGVPGAGRFDAMSMKQKIVSLSRGVFDAADAPGLIYNGARELADLLLLERRE